MATKKNKSWIPSAQGGTSWIPYSSADVSYSPSTLDYIMSATQQPAQAPVKPTKPWWQSVGEFTAAANEKVLGGTTRSLVNTLNLLGSGLNKEEAERRTKEFLQQYKQQDIKGESPLAQGYNRESGAFKAGQVAGDIEKTMLDVGLTLAPVGALENSLKAIPALQKLSQAGKLGKLGAGLAAAVPADIVQSIGLAGMDVAAGKDVNFLKDAGISAALTAAMPVLGAGVQKISKALKPAKVIEDAMGTMTTKLNPTDDVEALVQAYTSRNSKLLDTMNDVKGVNKAMRAVESQSNVVRSMGEAGQEFAARTEVREILKEQYRGQLENLLSSVRKAGQGEYKSMLNEAIDQIRKAKTDKARASLTGLAKSIADLQDIRRAQLVEKGIEIGQRQGYFTDMIKPGMEEEARKYIRDNITEQITKAVKAGDDEVLGRFGLTAQSSAQEIRDAALKEADGSVAPLGILRNKQGQMKAGVEFAKTDVLPRRFYETDPETILASWSDETAKRLADTQVFGKSDEVAESLLRRIGDESGEEAKKYVGDMLQLQRYGAPTTTLSPALKTMRSYQMLSKMGMSSITNAGQVANKLTMFGAGKTMKAYASVVKNWDEYIKMANQRGIGLTDITDDLMEVVYSGGKKNPLTAAASKMLDWNGFKKIETMHRLADIKIADDLIADMGKKGLDSKFTRDWLRRLDLNADAIIKQGLTPNNQSAITRQLVGAVDFFVDPKDVAKWATSSETGKTVSQLGKFGLKQGGFMVKQVLDEARRGNLVPALRWFVGAQIVGTGVMAAKGAITGKKRENDLGDAYNSLSETLRALESGDLGQAWEKSAGARQFATENVERVGGLGYAADVIRGLEYGDTALDKALGLLGPTVSDIKTGLSTTQSFLEGDTDKALRSGVKLVPGSNVWAPNIDRITGGNKFTFDPKGSAVYNLTKDLSKDEKWIPSRDDADAFGRAARAGDVSQTAIVETIARKLYDDKGQPTVMNPTDKAKLVRFLQSYGITDPAPIARQSYTQSKADSKKLYAVRKTLNTSEKAILDYNATSEKAQRYLDSIGKSLDDYPALKSYYEMREG